jgi:hypothetical protein
MEHVRPNCPVLAGALESLSRAHAHGIALLQALDADTGNRPPREGAWSALQAIEHLNVIADRYAPHMETAIARAPSGTAPYRAGTWVGRLLLRSVDPRSTRRLPAPRLFLPPATSLDPESVRERFDAHHERWRHLASAADGRDLGIARLRLPVTELLKISLEQAFLLHAAHEARHLAQAQRALELAVGHAFAFTAME